MVPTDGNVGNFYFLNIRNMLWVVDVLGHWPGIFNFTKHVSMLSLDRDKVQQLIFHVVHRYVSSYVLKVFATLDTVVHFKCCLSEQVLRWSSAILMSFSVNSLFVSFIPLHCLFLTNNLFWMLIFCLPYTNSYSNFKVSSLLRCYKHILLHFLQF